MTTKLGRMVVHLDGLLPIKSHDPARSHDKLKLLYLHYAVPMAMKLGRMVTYLEGLKSIKQHNALITWSCKITWQSKIIISLLPMCLWPPNLVGW